MVTMITLHILVQENRDEAVGVLTKNTELSRKAKGFVSREIFFALDDPLKGYSVSTWETSEDLENFRLSPDRPPLKREGDNGAISLVKPDGLLPIFTHTTTDIFERLNVQ